ncbi:MAG: hypothetical protein OJF55_001457 [Rhodanobacteraceae bacterium]|jgi:uncharacterized protein (TIGR02246 family)|nr:MAG: hypothetical protein OJF55_001457 [Rhodanobacteraceae bacterium]
MKTWSHHAMAVLALVGTMSVSSAHANEKSHAAAVRAVALQQADAWNRHDAAAYSTLFTADCDVVNVVGWWWKSRTEMQRKLTSAFSTVFRDSKLTFTDVQVKFLTPDVAIVHARWTMTGEHMPPGMPPPDQGIQTLVMTRHSGQWLIAVFQNTLSKPEHPFPAAASSGTH